MLNQNYKKVIVTGATGFIGQNLIPYLLEKNYDITAVSRSPEKAKRFKWFSKVKFIKADINHDPHLIDIGKNIGLSFNESKIHLFDINSGQRIN